MGGTCFWWNDFVNPHPFSKNFGKKKDWLNLKNVFRKHFSLKIHKYFTELSLVITFLNSLIFFTWNACFWNNSRTSFQRYINVSRIHPKGEKTQILFKRIISLITFIHKKVNFMNNLCKIVQLCPIIPIVWKWHVVNPKIFMINL